MKSRASKLDRYANQLAELDAEKKTLSAICEWLASEGCKVSPSSVSVYLERLRSQRRQAALLAQIASGARQTAEVEKQFAKNPAPALETITKLYRVLIMQLTTKSVDHPELIEVANHMTKTVMDFVSGQTKAEIEKSKINLAERRVKLLEAKAAAFDKVKEAVSSGGITPETLTKIERELKLL
jgi:hypothetical protein